LWLLSQSMRPLSHSMRPLPDEVQLPALLHLLLD
jgi:hypothetical protein